MVNIIGSHLLTKRMPSLHSFLLLVGVIYLTYGWLLFYLFPLPQGVTLWPMAVAVISGILRATALALMFYNLKREEVSRVIPVVYTYPIFVAIMAVPLLGESLGLWQWLAIIIVVAGAVMVSLKQNPFGATVWPGKPLLLLFTTSLFLALADITGKYVLAYISPYNIYSLSAFCTAGIFWLISLRSPVLRQLREMKGRNSALALLAFNETVAPVGVVLSFWAMARGPVSLVSTIVSSRPIFVVLFAFLLSWLFPAFLEWPLGKGLLALRLMATFLIVGGIAIIYLT